MLHLVMDSGCASAGRKCRRRAEELGEQAAGLHHHSAGLHWRSSRIYGWGAVASRAGLRLHLSRLKIFRRAVEVGQKAAGQHRQCPGLRRHFHPSSSSSSSSGFQAMVWHHDVLTRHRGRAKIGRQSEDGAVQRAVRPLRDVATMTNGQMLQPQSAAMARANETEQSRAD